MEKKSSLPRYEKPKVTTYTSEDILQVVGPIQAMSEMANLQGGGMTESQ